MILDKESIRRAAQGFAAVSEVLVYSLTGFGIGYFLDRWIGATDPWLKVVFTMLGMTGGFYRLYKVFTRDDDAKKNL